uniref:Putative replication factor-a protein n=1 Tax=Colletotrichum fructicola (strain Nara gc5) TaxID=1213859 RepID=L2G2L3_COLFN
MGTSNRPSPPSSIQSRRKILCLTDLNQLRTADTKKHHTAPRDPGVCVDGGSQQNGQVGGGGKAYSEESLRPVTIKQIIDAEEAYPGADFKIDGATVTQVTFVAQIRQISPQPTNITLKLDDGTGLIEAKKWVDTDKKDDDAAGLDLEGHVRVWGRIKSFNGKRHVGAHFIRPVTDFNEVNYHLLESTYLRGCSVAAQKMFNFINNAPGGNEGVHINQISTGAGLSIRDVMGAADELLGQGLIYTTIDDETWAILDY